jgi:hypothetical protein
VREPTRLPKWGRIDVGTSLTGLLVGVLAIQILPTLAAVVVFGLVVEIRRRYHGVRRRLKRTGNRYLRSR